MIDELSHKVQTMKYNLRGSNLEALQVLRYPYQSRNGGLVLV